MNYKESKLILEKIKKAKRIVLNCHRSPDPDGVGSALAFYEILISMGKEVTVVCPNEISTKLDFLHGYSKILQKVDFVSFDFSKFDLAIFCDSANWEMTSDSKTVAFPKINIVNIDHHDTNEKFGTINIIDLATSSSSEVIYNIFLDWKTTISATTAIDLLTGMIGDTGMFRFTNTTPRTIGIVKDLMEKGADKNSVVFNLYRRTSVPTLKLLSKVLGNIEVDKDLCFAWSAISYEDFVESGKSKEGKSEATEFFHNIEGTNFGFVIFEKEKGKFFVSFRNRTNFDVSKIASELGGGGHGSSAGVKIEGLPFDKAVEKVLSVARKYAKEYAKSASKGDAF
jgi:bifunctional oligoribonuclease and PAP phosphatase NrnA